MIVKLLEKMASKLFGSTEKTLESATMPKYLLEMMREMSDEVAISQMEPDRLEGIMLFVGAIAPLFDHREFLDEAIRDFENKVSQHEALVQTLKNLRCRIYECSTSPHVLNRAVVGELVSAETVFLKALDRDLPRSILEWEAQKYEPKGKWSAMQIQANPSLAGMNSYDAAVERARLILAHQAPKIIEEVRFIDRALQAKS